MYSVFEKLYAHVNEKTKVVKQNSAARNELQLIFRLAPFIRNDLKSLFSEFIICAHASSKRGGFVYFQSSRDTAKVLYAMSDDDRERWIISRSWRTARRHKWVETRHIHLLEGETLILWIIWFLRCGESLQNGF